MTFIDTAQGVLQFWLGRPPYDSPALQQRLRHWFAPAGPAGGMGGWDEVLRERYAGLLHRAENGELRAWEFSPRRRLALILLLDQGSRHIYRGTPAAYRNDADALALALSGMRGGADAALHAVERLFFYQPLMHAEAAGPQDESLAAYRRLREEAPEDLQDIFAGALVQAQRSRETILSHGRFPERPVTGVVAGSGAGSTAGLA